MWRDIRGFEGRYQISDTGDVRSLDFSETVATRWGGQTVRNRKGRVLAAQPFPHGYRVVTLVRDTCKLVHRLVAQAFVPGDTSLQVNHKNGIRSDNRCENLEWLSCSDNHRHSYRELSRKQHALTKAVRLIGIGVDIDFPSELAAAKHLGVVAGSVRSAVARGHRCKGYEVAYV